MSVITRVHDSKKPFLSAMIPKLNARRFPQKGVVLDVPMQWPSPKTHWQSTFSESESVTNQSTERRPSAENLAAWIPSTAFPPSSSVAGNLPEPGFCPLETNKKACLPRLLGLPNRTGIDKNLVNSLV